MYQEEEVWVRVGAEQLRVFTLAGFWFLSGLRVRGTEGTGNVWT